MTLIESQTIRARGDLSYSLVPVPCPVKEAQRCLKILSDSPKNESKLDQNSSLWVPVSRSVGFGPNS